MTKLMHVNPSPIYHPVTDYHVCMDLVARMCGIGSENFVTHISAEGFTHAVQPKLYSLHHIMSTSLYQTSYQETLFTQLHPEHQT